MHNIIRTTVIAVTFALGSAVAFADACTVRVVNTDAPRQADCVVAERAGDRAAFPALAGRAGDPQNGVVVTSSGSVMPIPVLSSGPAMVQTKGTLASPRAAGPMHVTLSW